ncbi:MAG: ATP-binding protein [Bermanella sp.]
MKTRALSIKRRMQVIAVGILAITWVVTSALMLFVATDIYYQFHDEDLVNFSQLLGDVSREELLKNSKDNQQILSSASLFNSSSYSGLAFEIVRNDQVLIRSLSDFPFTKVQLSPVAGFKSVRLPQAHGGKMWRQYTRFDAETNSWLSVAETSKEGDFIVNRVLPLLLWPILIMFPLTLFAIAFGVRHGLKPLSSLASHVEEQTPNFLKAISTKNVPVEVEPLVGSINSLLQRLNSAFENERHFTAHAAHELRTPLASLKIEAQTLQRMVDGEPAQRALQRIIVRMDSAAHMVSQLLTMSRVELGSELQGLKLLDLAEQVRALVHDMAQKISLKNINVRLDLANESRVSVEPGMLKILMANLLDNAIKYSQENGEISISVFQDKSYVQLDFADSGIGIAPGEYENVFDKFYRILGSGESGTGLGLSIVKRIVQIHNGQIVLEKSTLGGLKVSVKFKAVSLM